MAQVITVTGPISPDELGVTLVHVHLLQEIRMSATELGQSYDDLPVTQRVMANKPVTMDMLGIIRRHISLVTDNAILGDVDEMIDEAMHYKRMGGNSMVDCTLVGMGRDPVGIRKWGQA
jgi:phosphotriesterase-related protein